MTNPSTPTLPIKFGTDGWRAHIAEEYTFENVRFAAQGLCRYYHEHGLGANGVVVGYDTRYRSEDFAAATAEVIAGNGFKVYLCDRAAPTPVISHAVQFLKADGAAIITSSHNPAEYNGFKIKTADSSSAAVGCMPSSAAPITTSACSEAPTGSTSTS